MSMLTISQSLHTLSYDLYVYTNVYVISSRHARHQCTADASFAFLGLGGGCGGGTPGSAPGKRVAGFPLLNDLLQALLGVQALEKREDEVVVAVRAPLVVHLTNNASQVV